MKAKKGNILSSRSILVSASFGILIGLIAFAPIWIRNNGQLMDYGDYFIQYVPFIQEFKRMISSGNLAWSWNSYLGDSFINAYSYYTVFNPFAWFLICFPEDAILYGAMIATLLKLAVCMVCSFLFFQQFCTKDSYAILGALLYTFSGFTNVNTYFYFFLDTIAVFPLLMYGLERLIRDEKHGIYFAALVLNAAINYYLFVSTVILVILYVLFRLELYKATGWKQHWRLFLRVACYSMIGAGIASFALIPGLMSVLNSGKAIESVGSGFNFEISPDLILYRLYSLLAPSESSVYCAFFYGRSWTSTGAYLPLFGVCCVINYWIAKRDWLSKLTVFLFLAYMIPVLNSAFSLFSNNNYTRWLYGLVLCFALATVKFLEEVSDNKTQFNRKSIKGLLIFVAFYLLVPTVVYILEYFGIPAGNRFMNAFVSPAFIGYGRLFVILLITALNYLLMWQLTLQKNNSECQIVMCVALMCMVNMLVFNEINYDLHDVDSQYSNQYYYDKTMKEGTTRNEMVFHYRIDHPKQIRNYGLNKNEASVNNFNSLQNPYSIRYAVAAGIAKNSKETILLLPETVTVFSDALLSVKYFYDYDGNASIPEGFIYYKTENNVDIYENTNYLPMGFTYDKFCVEEDLKDLSHVQRCQAMLSRLVVKSDDVELVQRYLKHEGISSSSVALNQLISDRRTYTCSFFEGTSSGFSAQIDLDCDQIVFFSIPNDLGWDIEVNGVPAECITANYGFMGVVCPAGSNYISGKYHPKGVLPGILWSSVFILVYITVCTRKKRSESFC